ncbi:MAG: peptidoglycan-binding protein [Chloroflexota bacterium]|nr:peptidoglycan-binding protein [Chloroflexota bacterium]
MENTSFARAVIINLDQNEHVQCLFNPNEYTFSKQNSWQFSGSGGGNLPQLEFSGGQPAMLQMQLFFDTYETAQDVRKEYTDKIWRLMYVEPDLIDAKTRRSRPPRVRFQWGSFTSFDAVIISITQRFTLFLSNGTPARATLDVTFQQVQDERQLPAQNPTSGGEGGERIWTIGAGETLPSIAYTIYGDPNQWKRIADANALTQVRRLAPGTRLEIPNV